MFFKVLGRTIAKVGAEAYVYGTYSEKRYKLNCVDTCCETENPIPMSRRNMSLFTTPQIQRQTHTDIQKIQSNFKKI